MDSSTFLSVGITESLFCLLFLFIPAAVVDCSVATPQSGWPRADLQKSLRDSVQRYHLHIRSAELTGIFLFYRPK